MGQVSCPFLNGVILPNPQYNTNIKLIIYDDELSFLRAPLHKVNVKRRPWVDLNIIGGKAISAPMGRYVCFVAESRDICGHCGA